MSLKLGNQNKGTIMANNRMWLVNTNTGLGVLLGKRLSASWYSPPRQEFLQEFYDLHQSADDDDDAFILIKENDNNFKLKPELLHGFRQFIIGK